LFRDATCACSDAIQTTQRGVSKTVLRLDADFFLFGASSVNFVTVSFVGMGKERNYFSTLMRVVKALYCYVKNS